MVDPKLDVEACLRLIIEWAASLGSDVVRIEQIREPQGPVLRLQPVKPGCADIEFHISPYGSFGVYIGNFGWDDYPWSNDFVLDICEAVRHGRVVETRWEIFGKVIGTLTEIELSSRTLSDRQVRFPWPHKIAKSHSVHFDPWTDIVPIDADGIVTRSRRRT